MERQPTKANTEWSGEKFGLGSWGLRPRVRTRHLQLGSPWVRSEHPGQSRQHYRLPCVPTEEALVSGRTGRTQDLFSHLTGVSARLAGLSQGN